MVKLILARLLLPEHFGIVGMAVVFTSVISVLGEMGLSAALIEAAENHINRKIRYVIIKPKETEKYLSIYPEALLLWQKTENQP